VTAADRPPLPPALAVAWGVQEPSRRGPRPALSVERIVAAAVDLADEEGLAGVSMSRLAESVGFTTMSLYRYVSSKDDLLVLMADAAYGDPPDGLGGTDDWRAELTAWAEAALECYRAHPWVCDIAIHGPPSTPQQLAWLDRMLQGLRATDLDFQEQLSCALLLSGYVRDWATLTRGIRLGYEQRAAAGLPPLRFSAMFGAVITPDRFPALAPMIAAGEFDDDDEVEDFESTQFAFGLERVLDGIGVLVDQRAGRKSSDRVDRAAGRS
jgi:AcrR family transcriptional regulator